MMAGGPGASQGKTGCAGDCPAAANRGQLRSRSLEALELARRATELAAEKQAEDVLLLDLRRSCNFTDYFVLCTATSEPQVKAVVEELAETLPREGSRLLHSEGIASSGWVLLDFGDVVVHVFAPEQREFYDLEELWREATPLLRIQ